MLLCKTSLHFETSFSVEALIGITIDETEVVLVNIRESIQTDIEDLQSSDEPPKDCTDNHSGERWGGDEDHDKRVQSDEMLRKKRQRNITTDEWTVQTDRNHYHQTTTLNQDPARCCSIKKENPISLDCSDLRNIHRFSNATKDELDVNDSGCGDDTSTHQNLDISQSVDWARKQCEKAKRKSTNSSGQQLSTGNDTADSAAYIDAVLIGEDILEATASTSALTNVYFGEKSTNHLSDVTSSLPASESLYSQTVSVEPSYDTSLSYQQSNTLDDQGQNFVSKQSALVSNMYVLYRDKPLCLNKVHC